MRNSRLLLVLGAVAVSVACHGPGDSDPIPSTMPGSYVYAGKGSVFRKAWEFSARLDLTADRHFTMTLDKAIDGKADETETTSGAYALNGDEVELRVVGKRMGPEKDVHKLRVRGDSLIASVGWTGTLFLKGIGAPNVVFVKQHS
ncbi:MAG TPA: hypothetical protein VJ840_11690 [Gemmatimonadaceae bacterium]|nr:hypothetical protein [Gemmatimonadaceae bacterium]